MTVYIESNFILELMRLQEESNACTEILELARAGRVRLVLPAVSAAEPLDVVRRASAERRRLKDELELQLRLLRRTAAYAPRMAELTDAASLLLDSTRVEAERLHRVLAEVLALVEVIPITPSTVEDAALAQQEHGLPLQDSVVYTSVLEHARASAPGPKCFLDRDARHFDSPGPRQALRQYDCRIIPAFSDGLGFIRQQLRS